MRVSNWEWSWLEFSRAYIQWCILVDVSILQVQRQPNIIIFYIWYKIWLLGRVPLAHLYYKGLPGLNRSSRSQACYRLMLLAGTDPLIKDQRYMTTSVLSDVIRSGTSVSLVAHFHNNTFDNLSARTSDDASSCWRSHWPRGIGWHKWLYHAFVSLFSVFRIWRPSRVTETSIEVWCECQRNW